MVGGALRLGLPITEEITFQPRYTIYSSYISIPNNSEFPYNDCTNPIWGVTPGFGTGAPSFWWNCMSNGEASLALKQAQGTTVTSMPGFTLSYNSLDNNKSPTSGIRAEWREDFAGAGGDEHYIRSTGDFRYYHSVWEPWDIVGLVHLQGGYLKALGSNPLRIVDNFPLPAPIRTAC